MFFSYFYYSADGEGIVFHCLSSVSLVCDVHLSAPMSASLFNLTRQWSLNAIIADFPSPSSFRKNFDSFSKLFTLRRRGFSHIGALDGTVPVRGRDRESTVDVPLPKERQRSRIGAEETSFPTSNLRDADHRNPISTSQQNQSIQTFTSVYDLAKKQRPENEPSTEQAPIRTFKSIYEVARKDPDSASWGDKMKSIQDDFFEWHPEEKINHLKHVKRCQLQGELEKCSCFRPLACLIISPKIVGLTEVR